MQIPKKVTILMTTLEYQEEDSEKESYYTLMETTLKKVDENFQIYQAN